MFIVEAVFSGCISKVINDGKDYSWTKIKRVINDRNDRNLSTRIYRVIEKALIKVTDKKFKGTDILYEAIEKIFIEFRDYGSTIESVKCGLGMLNSNVTVERCENFLEKFYEGICQDGDLHKVIGLILQEKGNQINQEGYKQLNETVEYGFSQLNRKVDKIDEKISINGKNDNEENLQNKEPIKSRTQEYADKWNQNMFLNDFSEWDENAGINIKLKDVLYKGEHLPRFIWGDNINASDNLNMFLYKNIMKNNENKMLLILGQPGIGKSTLITWLTVKYTERIKDILVYKFADDLKNIDWQKTNISNEILNALHLSQQDLNGKIIIFDGFDEVNIEANRRRDILDNLYGEWIYEKDFKNISLIITCRENYIQGFERVKCNYITLQAWDEKQIKSFCDTFQTRTNNFISDDMLNKLYENKEIMGIPLILYMVLALDISIEGEGSIVDVYDKIFSLEGGIYDRCIDNKNFADKHRIGIVKKQIHQISREIALWMFENNSEEASIPQEEYQKICSNIIQDQKKNEEIEQDFLIGNFFKLVKHCEGIETEELYFIHRTIYEYFVVEIIYSSIESAMIKLIEESQIELAENIAFYLKEGKISPTIGEYLLHKIDQLWRRLDINKKNYFYQWWECTLKKMMEVGMFYFTSKCIKTYKNILQKEGMCFLNMLEILRLILYRSKQSYIMEEMENTDLIVYIKCCTMKDSLARQKKDINFSRLFLKGEDMKWIDLHGVNLNFTNLSECDLLNANLYMSTLEYAQLVEANLSYANLNNANLYKAKLNNAYLQECSLASANLENAELVGANLQRTFLMDAKLMKAKLIGADLSWSVLIDADLRGADILDLNLEGANLEGTIFDENQISYLKGRYDLSQVKIPFGDSNNYVGYDTYELMTSSSKGI